jgi:SSS family solute:Na+ symporter
MTDPLAAVLVFGYLALALGLGIVAGRRGHGGVADFVAGERAFGPLVMYFVMGATIFSAYALLGTPQRVVSKGSDVLYIFSYGAVGFVPLFFIGGRVRKIGAVEGFVTQAELVGARYDSRFVTGVMGAATMLSFLPYMVIQLKAAGIVMHSVTGWAPALGSAVVYAVVMTYVVVGGVRGVGWTNVLQGIGMLVVVWSIGLGIPWVLYGGIAPLFDRVIAQAPEHLTLPGPGQGTSAYQYSSEILVSVLGFSMWPHLFMKCFTARSARLVQLSVVLYPTFLFFLLPLVFLGYVAVLEGGPADDTVLLWVTRLPEVRAAFGPLGPLAAALVSFAVLAASMSTGDALLHAGSSIAVRDVLVGGLRRTLSDRAQTAMMRGAVLALGLGALVALSLMGDSSVVDLLLLAFAIPIQFLPLVLLGLYWRRANRVGAVWGLTLGLGVVLLGFAAQQVAPGLYRTINPAGLQIGVIGVAVNTVAMVILSLVTPPMPAGHLRRFLP